MCVYDRCIKVDVDINADIRIYIVVDIGVELSLDNLGMQRLVDIFR